MQVNAIVKYNCAMSHLPECYLCNVFWNIYFVFPLLATTKRCSPNNHPYIAGHSTLPGTYLLLILVVLTSKVQVSINYNDVIMGGMASQITSLTIVYSTVYSGADQRKHQSSASLAFVRGIHRWSVNSPHEWPVTRKMFPFDDVIMSY